jgi:hypothetical protein
MEESLCTAMLKELCEYNVIKFTWNVTIDRINPWNGCRIVSSAVSRDPDGLIVHAIAVYNEKNAVWLFGVEICNLSIRSKTSIHVGVEVGTQNREIITTYPILIPPHIYGEFLSKSSIPTSKTSIFGTVSYTIMYVSMRHAIINKFPPASEMVLSLPKGYSCKGLLPAKDAGLQIGLSAGSHLVNKKLMMKNSKYLCTLKHSSWKDSEGGVKLEVRESVFLLAVEWLETLFFTPEMCKYRQELFIFADRYGFRSLAIKCIEKINSIPLEKGCNINRWLSFAGAYAWPGVIRKITESIERNEVDFEKISFESIKKCPEFFPYFCYIVKKKLKIRCDYPCDAFLGSILYE